MDLVDHLDVNENIRSGRQIGDMETYLFFYM